EIDLFSVSSVCSVLIERPERTTQRSQSPQSLFSSAISEVSALIVVFYCGSCAVDVVVAARLYLSNQYRRYNCVRRKLDGVDVVPCHSLLNRTIAVGTFRSFSAL